MKSVRKIIRPDDHGELFRAIRDEIMPIERANVSLGLIRSGLPIINRIRQIIYDFCKRQSRS
jgi:hypothetical protein